MNLLRTDDSPDISPERFRLFILSFPLRYKGEFFRWLEQFWLHYKNSQIAAGTIINVGIPIEWMFVVPRTWELGNNKSNADIDSSLGSQQSHSSAKAVAINVCLCIN